MEKEKMGGTSRELFSQFIYRIHKDFGGKQALPWIVLKTKIPQCQIMTVRCYEIQHVSIVSFERGFMFSSESFYGSKSRLPVGFSGWN